MSIKKIDISITSQPDNTSCGPTALQAVYKHCGIEISLEQLISEIKQFEDGGGTLAVILGNHALGKGFKASLYTYNLDIFDPTWQDLKAQALIEKLKEQLKYKNSDHRFKLVSESYIKFLQMGGEILFEDLTPELIIRYIENNNAILTGLSATYLYQEMREDPLTCADDEFGGRPSGHFVVIHGYDNSRNEVLVADPYSSNPVAKRHHYSVKLSRLINAILLGVVTYDGNLLIISK